MTTREIKPIKGPLKNEWLRFQCGEVRNEQVELYDQDSLGNRHFLCSVTLPKFHLRGWGSTRTRAKLMANLPR